MSFPKLEKVMKLFGFVVMVITSMVVTTAYTDGKIAPADEQWKIFSFVIFCWCLTLLLAWLAWRKLRRNLAARREISKRSRTKPSLFSSPWDRDDHGEFWEQPNKS
jgi:hypothetical protein